MSSEAELAAEAAAEYLSALEAFNEEAASSVDDPIFAQADSLRDDIVFNILFE